MRRGGIWIPTVRGRTQPQVGAKSPPSPPWTASSSSLPQYSSVVASSSLASAALSSYSVSNGSLPFGRRMDEYLPWSFATFDNEMIPPPHYFPPPHTSQGGGGPFGAVARGVRGALGWMFRVLPVWLYLGLTLCCVCGSGWLACCWLGCMRRFLRKGTMRGEVFIPLGAVGVPSSARARSLQLEPRMVQHALKESVLDQVVHALFM